MTHRRRRRFGRCMRRPVIGFGQRKVIGLRAATRGYDDRRKKLTGYVTPYSRPSTACPGRPSVRLCRGTRTRRERKNRYDARASRPLARTALVKSRRDDPNRPGFGSPPLRTVTASIPGAKPARVLNRTARARVMLHPI